MPACLQTMSRCCAPRKNGSCSRADVVLVTAPALLESKRQFSDNVYLVPNAVDFAGFRQTLATTSRPGDMAGLPQAGHRLRGRHQ